MDNEYKDMPRPGDFYKHFKGGIYQIIALAKHSETDELLVIYQAMYGSFEIYARPLDMFMSEVDHKKYPEVKEEYRFTRYENVTEEMAINERTTEERTIVESAVEDYCEDKYVEEGVNRDLIHFLEADTAKEKREVLIGMQNRLTDRMINDIAASMDIIVDEGDIDTRMRSVLNCLDKLAKYENTRLR